MPSVRTTAGRLLLEDALPPGVSLPDGPLDKKALAAVGKQLAALGPDVYRETQHRLHLAAEEGARASGGYSFSVDDLDTPPAIEAVRGQARQAIAKVLADRTLTRDQRAAQLVETAKSFRGPLETAVKEWAKQGNPLALQVLSGAKGKPDNLLSLLGGDVLYDDPQFRPVPFPVLRSYSEGLMPHEFFAGSFGARQGVVTLKLCLAEDTGVRMADGSVRRIRDIQSGDLVVGVNRDGVTSPTRVRAVYDNGPRICRKYRFRDQSSRAGIFELVATPDHRVLARLLYGKPGSANSQMSVYEPTLIPLSRACKVFRASATTGGAWAGVNEPRAVLLGVLLGDGYLGREGRVGSSPQLSCADPSLIEDTAVAFASVGIVARPATGFSFMLTRPGNTGGRNPLSEWLRELNLFGKRSVEKFIPDCVWGWDDPSVAALVGGLIATDGYILNRPKAAPLIRFSSVSKAMVFTLRDLLAVRFGVHCPPPLRLDASKIKYGNYDQWSIAIGHQDSIRRFHAAIPLPGVKRKALEQLLTRFVKESDRKPGYNVLYRECEDAGVCQTFDLEVEHPDHMFLLGNGLISANSTAQTGYFSKRLLNASHRLVVTGHDGPDPHPDAAPRGVPVPVDDPDNKGALLAHPAGPYPRNTVLTHEVLGNLKDAGVDRILVRSPMVGGPADGGVYARDAGLREGGLLPGHGYRLGQVVVPSVTESVVQTAISAKHGGGVSGSSDRQQGFPVLDQLASIPHVYPGGAAYARLDGPVTKVEEAPQGGTIVTVGDEHHYVGPDRKVLVKPGDKVEAGDELSDGLMNPAEVVRYRGIGEGRRRFVEAFQEAAKASGFKPDRRNLEVVARGLVNHVRLTREVGDFAPDDLVPYSSVEAGWTPRDGAKRVPVKDAVGQYLEEPALHHSLGTRVTRRAAAEMAAHGVTHVVAHPSPPPFEPVMIRSHDAAANDPDWMTRFIGVGLEKGFLAAAHRFGVSDQTSTSFVPALAAGGDRLVPPVAPGAIPSPPSVARPTTKSPVGGGTIL